MRLMMSVSAWGLMVGAALASGDGAGSWRVEAGALVARLRADGSVCWRFQYSPEQTHAYFHPLAPAGRDSLTVDEPGDHVHHHGLWFSWKYINGVNFWEHAPGATGPREGPFGPRRRSISAVTARRDSRWCSAIACPATSKCLPSGA